MNVMKHSSINFWCICVCDLIVESSLNAGPVGRTSGIYSVSDGLGRVMQSTPKKRAIPRLNRLKGAGDADAAYNFLKQNNTEGAVEQDIRTFLGAAVFDLHSTDDKVTEQCSAILQHRFHELLYGSTNSQGVGVDYLGHIACVDDGDGNTVQGPPVAATTSQECLQIQQEDRLADRLLTTMEQ
jgi:hypothetical protein